MFRTGRCPAPRLRPSGPGAMQRHADETSKSSVPRLGCIPGKGAIQSTESHMQPVPAAQRTDILSLLYQSVLIGVVRIQSGRQPLMDLEVFRRRMKTALQEVEREAGSVGYAAAEIRDAEFAVVAFLDETILSSRDAKADEWRK